MLPGAEATLLAGDNRLSATSRADLNALEADLRGIPGIRQSVDAGTMTPAAAFQAYSSIIDAQFQFYYAETLDQGTSMQAIGHRRHRRGAASLRWSAGRRRWWTAR